nr:MAG TPA: hypothetical protein [Bacteriophage sp.]
MWCIYIIFWTNSCVCFNIFFIYFTKSILK